MHVAPPSDPKLPKRVDSFSLEADLAELHLLVARGESEQTEFKNSTGQRTEAVKTVCAMLNTVGGFVIFGADGERW